MRVISHDSDVIGAMMAPIRDVMDDISKPLPDGCVWVEHPDITGLRRFMLFTPDAPSPSSRIIIMLHGCLQGAHDFCALTDINRAANRAGHYVIYPQQNRNLNGYRCWNWHIRVAREAEMALIISMARHAAILSGARSEQMFVAGLSAGGIMANTLLNHFSHLFIAGAVHSGVHHECLTSPHEAREFMRNGPHSRCAPPLTRRPLMVLHGLRDEVVSPKHAEVLCSTLGNVISDRLSGAAAFKEYERGRSLLIANLAHAWSGGAFGHRFSQPGSISASNEIMRFFSDADEGVIRV